MVGERKHPPWSITLYKSGQRPSFCKPVNNPRRPLMAWQRPKLFDIEILGPQLSIRYHIRSVPQEPQNYSIFHPLSLHNVTHLKLFVLATLTTQDSVSFGTPIHIAFCGRPPSVLTQARFFNRFLSRSSPLDHLFCLSIKIKQKRQGN